MQNETLSFNTGRRALDNNISFVKEFENYSRVNKAIRLSRQKCRLAVLFEQNLTSVFWKDLANFIIWKKKDVFHEPSA